MTDLKMPTSDRHDFQIECLKNREHAAAYLEAILEEEDPEPQLLRNALRKVIEARSRSKLLSENDELLHRRLDAMLTKSGCAEIYALVELLDAVDLKLTISLLANTMKNNRVRLWVSGSPCLRVSASIHFGVCERKVRAIRENSLGKRWRRNLYFC